MARGTFPTSFKFVCKFAENLFFNFTFINFHSTFNAWSQRNMKHRKIKKLGNFLIRKFEKKMFPYLKNFQKISLLPFLISAIRLYFFLFFYLLYTWSPAFLGLKFPLTRFWSTSILIYREFLCTNRVESSRQSHEEQPSRQHPASNSSTTGHEHLIRRNHSEVSERENDVSYRARPRPRTHHYAMERPAEQEVSRPRPRSFYENPTVGRDFREQRNVADPREVMTIDSTISLSDHRHILFLHISAFKSYNVVEKLGLTLKVFFKRYFTDIW